MGILLIRPIARDSARYGQSPALHKKVQLDVVGKFSGTSVDPHHPDGALIEAFTYHNAQDPRQDHLSVCLYDQDVEVDIISDRSDGPNVVPLAKMKISNFCSASNPLLASDSNRPLVTVYVRNFFLKNSPSNHDWRANSVLIEGCAVHFSECYPTIYLPTEDTRSIPGMVNVYRDNQSYPLEPMEGAKAE